MPGHFRSPSQVLRRLRLTPLAARTIENWPRFMFHYALGLVPGTPYTFHSGARLGIGRAVDHVPIIEIFLREDYGRIPDDAVVLDLGANIGAFAVYAATTARNARVYAYEPSPDFFELLRMNVRLNGLEGSITCFNLAVAADTGDRELVVAGTNLHFPTLLPPAHVEGAKSATVRCTNLAAILDASAPGYIDLLKMDIEGAEYESFYGAPAACFERIREIRLEYHNLDADRRNVGSLKAFLVSQRYRITRDQANSPTHGNLWVTRHD